MAFLTAFQSTTSRGTGIWTEDGDHGLELIARTGGAAPGTDLGVFFSSLGNNFGNFAFNNAGQTAFLGKLSGTGVTEDRRDEIGIRDNEVGIWSEGGGNGLQLVARSGNLAPGAEPDEFFRVLQSGPPATFPLNDRGQIAFVAELAREDQDGHDAGTGTGIWSEAGGNGLALIARTGGVVPGMENDAGFHFFGTPTLNNAGSLAFHANTESASGDSEGIWLKEKGSELTLVVRAGSDAPDAGFGVEFAAIGSPLLNGAGKIAFNALLVGVDIDDGNNGGIWSGKVSDGFSLVAREGSAAPGTDPGVKFSSFRATYINGPGQTAFVGTLTGLGVDETNDLGIWAEDLLGNLKLIAREGDLIDVDDSSNIDLRRITAFPGIPGYLTGSGNEDGRRSFFNDHGQVVFSASFPGSISGLFVSNLVAVPEPNTLWLLTLAAVGWIRPSRLGMRSS